MPLLSHVGTPVPEPLKDKVSSGCPGGISKTLRRLQKVEKECVRRQRVGKIQARMLGWAGLGLGIWMLGVPPSKLAPLSCPNQRLWCCGNKLL